MSKPLFEFVKVAAGDRFRWESGNYSFVEGQLNLDNVVNSSWIANEPVNIDTWFLRPVEWAEFIHPHTRALREILAILKDAPSNASAVLAVMQEAASALESLRPAESPDAGREAIPSRELVQAYADGFITKPARIVAMETFDWIMSRVNQYYQVAGIASTTPSLPATNVGDIPAGREGFIEKVIEKVIEITGGVLYRRDAFADFMRSHWPTPADPGSQVDAVDPADFADWSVRRFDSRVGGWVAKESGFGKKKLYSTADLITLYKQSL